MLTCTTCKASKPVEEFPFRDKAAGKRRPVCSECLNSKARSRYREVKEVRRSQYRASKQKRRTQVRELLSEVKKQPCTDCKQTFPSVCMDFDHVRGEKRFNISSFDPVRWAMHQLKEEIAKCEIVCANCHRIRTWKRMVGEAEVVEAPGCGPGH